MCMSASSKILCLNGTNRASGYPMTLKQVFALSERQEKSLLFFYQLLNYWGMLSSHQQAEYLQYDEGCYGVNGPSH